MHQYFQIKIILFKQFLFSYLYAFPSFWFSPVSLTLILIIFRSHLTIHAFLTCRMHRLFMNINIYLYMIYNLWYSYNVYTDYLYTHYMNIIKHLLKKADIKLMIYISSSVLFIINYLHLLYINIHDIRIRYAWNTLFTD